MGNRRVIMLSKFCGHDGMFSERFLGFWKLILHNAKN